MDLTSSALSNRWPRKFKVDVRGLAIDLKAVFGRLNKKC